MYICMFVKNLTMNPSIMQCLFIDEKYWMANSTILIDFSALLVVF